MKRRLFVLLLLLLAAVGLLIYFWAEWVRYALLPVILALAAPLLKYLIQEWIVPLIIEIVGGKLERNTPDTISGLRGSKLNFLNIGDHREIKKHLDEQVEKIKNMPFVFEDVTEIDDLVDNFIDIEATNIDPISCRPTTTRSLSKEDLIKALKINKKIVLLGGAGIGKTTFQRHNVLTIIRKRQNVTFLEPDEGVVPFYIQLRFVDNSKPLPIRRHLLNDVPYFATPSGNQKLLNLARKKKLFLFLDGYDEIPFTLTQKDNHLRDELKILLSPGTVHIASRLFQSNEEEAFYKNIQRCRVWLSCRKEFFRDQTPFKPFEVPMSGLAALEIKGVDSRLELIEKVFSRYKPIKDNKGLFSAKLFFNLINRDVGELNTLSNNPLLLIIICRIYAHEVIRTREPKVQIANTLDTLIEKYLELLLVGLDDYRYEHADLSGADKDWQKESRSLYIEEKREFLKYFAGQLYIKKKDDFPKGYITFPKDYIKSEAINFFTDESASPHREVILEALSKSPVMPTQQSSGHTPGMSDFVGQISNCGILVITENREVGQERETVYDFPHQRFRELLAAQYFESTDWNYIVNNLKQMARNGLLYVFFRITIHKDAVIEGLLDQIIKDEEEANDYLIILLSCLEQTGDYHPQDAFEHFFSKCLSHNLSVNIPEELEQGLEKGKYFKTNAHFTQTLTKHFAEATSETLNAAGLSGELLFIYEQNLLKYLLNSYFNNSEGSFDSEIFNHWGDLLFRCDESSGKATLTRHFNQCLENSNEHAIKLCCQFLAKRDPKLLEGLFSQVVTRAVKRTNVKRSAEVLLHNFLLLQRSNEKLFNVLFAKVLLTSIESNDFTQIPHKILDLYHPNNQFNTNLIKALVRGIDNSRLFSIWLAVELGIYYYGADFDTQLTKHLMPALKSGNQSVEHLIVASKQINRRLKSLCPKYESLSELLYLADMCEKINPIKVEVTEDLTSPPQYCYIITYRIIKDVQQLIQEQGIKIDRKDWRRLYKLMYRTLLVDDFNEVLTDSFPLEVRKRLMEFSQIVFSNYETIMRSFNDVKDKDFNNHAFII